MEVKLASKEDISGILSLQPQVHRSKKSAENSEEILEEIIHSKNCEIVVARQDERVLGSAFIFYHLSPHYGKPYAIIEDMVVDENQRSGGVGSEIIRKVIELAKKRKSYKIILTSGFDRDEIHKFYERSGFEKWGFEFRMGLN